MLILVHSFSCILPNCELSKKMLIFSKVSIITLLCTMAHAQLNPIIEEQIDSYIQDTFMASNHVPGMTLSIVLGDNVYQKAYGYRKYEEQIEADEHTLFAIGSIAKSFTATIVARTVAEYFPELGEAALDTPIKTLLPGLNFTMSDRYRSENVNLRDLLAHRTCLRPDFIGLSTNPYTGKHEWHYRQRYAKEVCPFRSSFVYNNAMTSTASWIAEVIAGKTFETMVDEFFAELGMHNSTYIKDTDDDDMPNRALSYYYRNNETHYFNSGLLRKVYMAVGSGGILTNAADMARYMRFHLSYGLLDGIQIVPEHIMRWLTRLSNAAVLDSTFDWDYHGVLSGDYGYGLSFFLGVHDGTERVSHGGNIGPFVSFMSLYPKMDLGIFSSTNGPGNIDQLKFEALYNFIFQLLKGNNNTLAENQPSRLNGLKYENPLFKPSSQMLHRKKPTKTSGIKIVPEDVVGDYGHPAFGELSITLQNRSVDVEQLYMEYGDWGHGWLHESESSPALFELELTTDLVHEAYVSGVEEPVISIEFVSETTFIMYVLTGETIEFTKDLSLEDLPEQPWDPASCSPDY